MSDTCSVCGGKLHRDEVFGEHTSPLDCVDVMRTRLDAAEAERDKLRKRSTERRVQVTDLYGNLSLENDRLCTKLAAVEDDVMEIAKVLYFGFMICESQCGRAEVRIKFADLKYAQRLHSILVKIRNKRDIHDEAAKGGRDDA